MQLHQRGVDLLVDVMDAADHVEQLTPDEIRRLLKEVVEVVSLILERDALIALNPQRPTSARESAGERPAPAPRAGEVLERKAR